MCKFTTFLLIFIILSLYLSAQNPDIWLLEQVNDEHPKILRKYSLMVTNTATTITLSTPFVIGMIGIIDKNSQLEKDALYVGATLGVEGILTLGLKQAVHRERPYVTYPNVVFPYQILPSYSFPSGHTSMAFANATALSLKYPKWYVIIPSYFWACSVGYSRLNLGEHYPSDVLAGAIVGAGSAFLSLKLTNWLFNSCENKKQCKILNIFSTDLSF
ncbi:MAG: phosphatase PAP2 family protein [Paludibacteraceae bacterium]|nr:phosphatase PAP2 family protein [Paludibacteraceae bacterium]